MTLRSSLILRPPATVREVQLGVNDNGNVGKDALIDVRHVNTHMPDTSGRIDPVGDKSVFATALEIDCLRASAVAWLTERRVSGSRQWPWE